MGIAYSTLGVIDQSSKSALHTVKCLTHFGVSMPGKNSVQTKLLRCLHEHFFFWQAIHAEVGPQTRIKLFAPIRGNKRPEIFVGRQTIEFNLSELISLYKSIYLRYFSFDNSVDQQIFPVVYCRE